MKVNIGKLALNTPFISQMSDLVLIGDVLTTTIDDSEIEVKLFIHLGQSFHTVLLSIPFF
jgi:hypothetical protein